MSKISLCMIVGNVEEYIDRCLESFKPIADEICVVRAIGNQTPDRTLDIARDKFGARVGEYKNAPEHADWPHVDNFAAARQQSFDMATHDYCFWCDSDDVLESGADLIRKFAADGGYPVFMFPYKIFGRGITVMRERMILKSAGHWQYAVHECFKFHIEPATGLSDDRVVVTHKPNLDKTGSNGRNLRIMKSIPEAEMSAGMLYHMHGELLGIGDTKGAIECAQKALAKPDIGRPEKYEIFLNLGLVSENPQLRAAYWHQAHAADPTRREALGLLACNAMDVSQNFDALSYARQMMSCIRPKVDPWNLRQDFYGYVGNDIYSQALRANGNIKDAETVRLETLKEHGGPSIALVHATRGRPIEASKARKAWLSLAENPGRIEHIFVFDEDDVESEPLSRFHHIRSPKGGGCVAAWNLGAMSTQAPIIVQLSDDWQPPMGWDRIIMERIGDTSKPAVLAVSDGARKDKLLCMAICTRNYYLQDFFLFHPFFTGVYSDNWFTDVAYRRNQVIEARDVVFKHMHPIFTGKPVDKTYAEQNAPHRYEEGQKVYEFLKSGNDFSTVHGWFNYIPFYQYVADKLQDGDTICEVGCWMGRSIIFMAQTLKRQGKKVKIFVVDTFKGEDGQTAHVPFVQAAGGSIRKVFEDNCKRCGVDDMITILEGDSAEMAKQIPDNSLAFCYIDAAHSYEGCKRDIEAYYKKISKFGIFAGHDAGWHEVIKAVDELLQGYQVWGPCWAVLPSIEFNDPERFKK